jgi:trans-aconitate 2-methyltransferase
MAGEQTGAYSAYSFGDNPVARARLALLAAVFEPTTRRLLASVPGPDPETVIDLGCGPGHTTDLLSASFQRAEVIGLDTSPAFVTFAAARVGGNRRVSFRTHDVTQDPLPGGPADLIFARFLLAHLPGPEALVEAWAKSLTYGGRLVLEEVEWIESGDEVLLAYLALMAGVLRARQTELYIGPLLGSLHPPPETAIIHNDVATLSPQVGHAAQLFSLNLETVRHDPYVLANYPADEVNLLSRELSTRLSDASTGRIRWGMRQLILRS